MSDIQPSKVVINIRGEEPIEWSTEDGLKSISMAPFGVVGEFEGKEVRQQMVSWYEVSSFKIYDLDFVEPEAPKKVETCTTCAGTGLVNGGEDRCSVCEGWGHVR